MFAQPSFMSNVPVVQTGLSTSHVHVHVHVHENMSISHEHGQNGMVGKT